VRARITRVTGEKCGAASWLVSATRFDHSALKRKAVRSVETPGTIQPTRRHMPQDLNVQQDRCENPNCRKCMHSFSCRNCEEGGYYNNNNNNNNNNNIMSLKTWRVRSWAGFGSVVGCC